MRKRLLISVAVAALSLAHQGLAQTRSVLPMTPPPFTGTINDTTAQSTPSAQFVVRAPAGAPNIFLFMADDVGFSMSSVFGGPVPTPNMERLAAHGQRYNRFFVTSICSPSRAALLTGRNHHNAATGMLADIPMGYPGYDAHIPPSTATIAQTLRLNGYNTAMFGKHHNVPPGENSAAGPFDTWPTGLGFEYFFGFPQGDSDQWRPNLYRGTNMLPDYDGPPMLVERRLADDAITWVHNQKAAAPDKPFFIYYAPGSTHAPHQAPADYIARFKGKFDQGWDKVREETFQRQLKLGIVPPNTKLTARPDEIPAWDSITPAQRAFAARTMEVAAAMQAYQDEQLGHVLDELQRMGQLENTLVVVVQGDNGASGDAGVHGTTSEWGHAANKVKEDDAFLAANLDKLGGEYTYENYPIGWAWAMNTPFRYVKMFASMMGGIRNGAIIAWPGHVAQPNSVCGEFGHLIDIAPTLLDAARLPAPDTVYGVPQKPLDGHSLVPSLSECKPDRPRTQYFEMTGKAALYHDGWFASNDDGRMPWQGVPPEGPNPPAHWTLYNLKNDFSQADDLSAKDPDRLHAMIGLWHAEAARNNVFPVNHAMGAGRGIPPTGRKQWDLWGKDVSIPAHPEGLLSRNPFAGSFTLDAEIVLDKDRASGVVAAVGSHFAGWSFYLDKGQPAFAYAKSTRPDETFKIVANKALPKGPAKLRLTVTVEGPYKSATVEIRSGEDLASGRIPATFVVPAGVGEMLDAGRDTGVAVTDYATPHGRIEGDIRRVSISIN